MSETNRTPKERAPQFVGALRHVRHDRGKLAALRRGLSDHVRLRVEAWPVVAGLGGDIGQPACLAIAALFAAHPNEADARNFGETCRGIALGRGKVLEESFERRFRRLLACGDVDDLVGQLRSWIRLAAGRGVGVNYESLYADLCNWPWYADDIRVRWARCFWLSGDATPTETSTTLVARA